MRRNRQRLSLQSLSQWPAVVMTALLIGGVSALAASLLRLAFRALEWCFTQHTHELPLAAAGLPPGGRVLVPVLGGLCAAAVLAVRARVAKASPEHNRNYGEYVEAVRRRGGVIPLLPNLWRTASSAFSVATGAAIGREGSMIQFAATFASLARRKLVTRLRWMSALPLELAVACGVAGGVTAAYQAPVAGCFFAAEIVLGELHLPELVPVGVAALAGAQVSRMLLEPGPLYPLKHVVVWNAAELWQLPILALGLGALAPLYQRWLQLFHGARRLPLALVWGGLAVGMVSLWEPRVWGNGDIALAGALGAGSGSGGFSTAAHSMLLVLAARMLVTAFDVGVGTVGGVFTPTLFTGATLGLLAAAALHVAGVAADTTLFAVAGMSALIAAATHAPLMSAAISAELTGQWRLFPVLLALDLLAWLLARSLSGEALYAIASQTPVHRGLRAPHRRWLRRLGGDAGER